MGGGGREHNRGRERSCGWVCRDEEGRADTAVLTPQEWLKGWPERADSSRPPPRVPPPVRKCQPLDLPDSFHLGAGVRDGQGLEASTALRVNIVNVNDEAPRFTR